MADDDLDDDFGPAEAEEDIDEAVLDDDALEADITDDAELVDGDELTTTTDDEAEAVVDEPAARAKKRREDEEDDDEELDPDDVEADLDTILKDRIAAVDDDEDEDELEEAPRAATEGPDGVIPKRANEFMCTGCFLLVNRGQFGPESNMQCPVGESECPAIDQLRASPKPKPIKAARKR